jgi:hypothetical protein
MALSMKREWKKGNDSDENHSGYPETAHMHETHDVIQIVASKADMPIFACIKEFGGRTGTRWETCSAL